MKESSMFYSDVMESTGASSDIIERCKAHTIRALEEETAKLETCCACLKKTIEHEWDEILDEFCTENFAAQVIVDIGFNPNTRKNYTITFMNF